MRQSVSMPKLDQKIAAIEERLQRLKLQHKLSETRRRARETRRTRQAEARRRNLVGAIALARVERGLPGRPKCGSPVGYDDPNPDL